MDIYDEIGVTRVINASGSMTFLGGSLMAPEVIEAMDREKMQRLPDTAGMKNEFVVQKLHRISFDHALRAAGGRLVEVGSREGTEPRQIEAAIGEHTGRGAAGGDLAQSAAPAGRGGGGGGAAGAGGAVRD